MHALTVSRDKMRIKDDANRIHFLSGTFLLLLAACLRPISLNPIERLRAKRKPQQEVGHRHARNLGGSGTRSEWVHGHINHFRHGRKCRAVVGRQHIKGLPFRYNFSWFSCQLISTVLSISSVSSDLWLDPKFLADETSIDERPTIFLFWLPGCTDGHVAPSFVNCN